MCVNCFLLYANQASFVVIIIGANSPGRRNHVFSDLSQPEDIQSLLCRWCNLVNDYCSMDWHIKEKFEYTGYTRKFFENKELVSKYILSFTNVIFKVTYWPTFNYLTYAQCKRNLYLKNFVWNTDFSKSSFCLKSNSYITKITRATSSFKWPDSFLLL